ncbi:hypothetical protein ACGF8B_39230 [Streptomyces sp. NPDC047917]|uniref:hypothetical protein n=1 Tax=Streptomyces sp. NPDC047917 TaxID=3365491 RepID=UPI003715CADE
MKPAPSPLVDAVTLKAALADIEQPLSGTVLVDRLHLVEQRHDGAHIMWDPVAEVRTPAAEEVEQSLDQAGTGRPATSSVVLCHRTLSD